MMAENPVYGDDNGTDEEEDDNILDTNEKTPILVVNNQHNRNIEQKTTCYVYCLALFAAIGGFLFGYDTGVISGAMIPLKKHFDLSKELQEVVVSLTVAGAILGAMTSGFLNERFGRRVVLLIAAFIFTVGAILMGVAATVVEILIGRLIVGIGIGYASSTVPVYIAEAAPTHKRGQLVTINQLFITFGQLAASVLNGAFSYIEKDNWRYMLGIGAVPSLILFLGFLFMPKSPRWLISKGRISEAKDVLLKLRGVDNVDEEVQHIQKAFEESNKTNELQFKRIFTTPSTRRALILGCGLQAFQQLSGINTVMYYSGTIIELAGVQNQTTVIWLTAVVASGNFIFTLISMSLIERVGRRKLNLFSIFGVTVALCLLGCTFIVLNKDSPKVTLTSLPRNLTDGCQQYTNCYTCIQDNSCGFCYVKSGKDILNGTCLRVNSQDPENATISYCNSKTLNVAASTDLVWSDSVCSTSYAWLAVIAMIFYLAMFAPGMGPMPWTVNAEIYPLWARSFGTSASTTTNWTFNLFVALTFLDVMDLLTRPGAFFLYAGISFVGFVFVYCLQPETRAKPLEDVEKLFEERVCVPCGSE